MKLVQFLSPLLAIIALSNFIPSYASDWQSDSSASVPLQATVSDWESSNNNQNAPSILIETPPYSSLISRGRKVGPEVFRKWLNQTHPEFATLISKDYAKASILEVKGKWDDADHTLRSFDIFHTTIKPNKLTDISLDAVKVIIVNCAGDVPKEAYQRIRDYVAKGGFLISTDWTVHNLLERAFPGYIEWNGNKAEGGTVDATVISQDPILCKGAVRRSGWKLDNGSQTIRILRPQAVRVIARSNALSQNEPERTGILAVTFQFGRGQVLHLVGHFDNNSNSAFDTMLPDPAPYIGISLRQAITCNFLIAGLERNLKPQP